MMRIKAAVLYAMQMPRPYATSRPVRVEAVRLDPPGPHEVLVAVKAAGICHSDLSVVDGARPRPLPMVLGHEASGVVAEVGREVTGFRAGDHVVFAYVPRCGECEYCVAGRPALCEQGNRTNTQGTLLAGGVRFANGDGVPVHHHLGVSAFATHTVVSARSLIKIDRAFPLERAAIFGCAVLTGVGAIFNTAQVNAGEGVAIFGLGGVGLSAVIGARAAGAWPIIAVDRVEAKLRLAEQLGATHVLRAGERDVVNAIRDLTHGGVHHAFEAIGNARVWSDVFAATRRGGQAVAIGVAAPDVEYRIPAVALVGEAKTVKGCYMGSAVPARDIPRFLQLHLAGNLPVDRLVTHTVPLEAINEALDALAEARAVRQLVVFGD